MRLSEDVQTIVGEHELPVQALHTGSDWNASLIANYDGDTHSIGVLKRSASEGEAVTKDLKHVDLQDSESPSSAAAVSAESLWHLPRKRPSNNTLPEGDTRVAKLHERPRSTSDPFLRHGSSQSGQCPTLYDSARSSPVHRPPQRPLTPRMTKLLPLDHRYDINSQHLSIKQAGNPLGVEGL